MIGPLSLLFVLLGAAWSGFLILGTMASGTVLLGVS